MVNDDRTQERRRKRMRCSTKCYFKKPTPSEIDNNSELKKA